MQLKHHNSKFKKKGFPIVLITDSVLRPANLGSLLRAADAFGVQKIIFGGNLIPLNRKTWSASRAAEKTVDYNQTENTLAALQNHMEQGYKIVALEITQQSKPIKNFKVDPFQKTVLIVGSERYGLSKEILELSHEVYHIEMYGQNSSMNVAQATSIALYEISNKLQYA